ncbi:FHA domain-containing protein, partial [Limosilactobacillus sp. c11Ua_112_M]|nr:FHA domain-containing protein [Limosilactobacillus portuensis]
MKVGRNNKECQLVLTHPSISSIHCVFWCVFFDEDSIPMFYVKDCSLNGTYLNGLLLKRDKTYLLNDCDTIELSRGNEEN